VGLHEGLERSDEPLEHFRSAQSGKLECQRLRAADIHLELHPVECRRAQPLALKLTRLGGAEMLEGLIRALKALV